MFHATLPRIISNPINSCHRITLNIRLFYDHRTRSNTIFAPATAPQSAKGSPLGVVRVSGTKTSHVIKLLTNRSIAGSNDGANELTDKPNGKILVARRATLARLIDPKTCELIDIGLILWFPKPNSYTGEDACEFQVHGSRAVMRKLLACLGSLEDLRPAEPGEFTRRAVKNRKLTLMQAESLPELISSQTDNQRKLALSGLLGTTQEKYSIWIESLVHILAHLEASIDFGEDELIGEEKVVDECIQKISTLHSEITKFINVTSKCRNFIRSGAKVSILGRPNAGKSTLMNLLCQQEKSIVSNLSGTTRDVIEHSFEFNGHSLTICDTAGIKDMNHEIVPLPGQLSAIEQHEMIEREGMKRALDSATSANVVLYVLDATNLDTQNIQAITDELSIIFKESNRLSNSTNLHLVINKIDLNLNISELDLQYLEESIKSELSPASLSISCISCKDETNIELMIGNLTQTLDSVLSCVNRDLGADLYHVNERHLSLIVSALKHLEQASRLQMKNIDLMAQHVRESVDYLSRIVGTVSNEQVLDIIFRDFCIGK